MSSQQAQITTSTPGKLWGGRFTEGQDPLMQKYNASIYYDRAFYRQDIAGSIAWARANKNRGILTAQEFSTIERGLNEVLKEWDTGTFKIVDEIDEDIHTANERRLSEIEIGGKLHTGRSRNEQVASDMRMWLVEQLQTILEYLENLIKAMTMRAEIEIDVCMPGYTHLQRAQPIRWSHWLCSYAYSFSSDLERLKEVIRRSPLGLGALAGNPFGIDREAIAKELGFAGLMMNSLNGVGDRDFATETMQWASMLMGHISRISEDLIIYSTAEFGFLKLSDAYSTGSSLMPQKKNSDSLELLRGKSGRVMGQMMGLMVTTKGLPSTYNKDLQESVEPLLDCVKTTSDSIRILTGVISTLVINPGKMLAALTPDMLATDLADYLVRKGVPFRETHHLSGQVVALAESKNLPMDQLSHADLQSVDKRLGSDFIFDYEKSVEMRTATGGTSKSSVQEQIAVLKKMLTGQSHGLSSDESFA
ncbi:hypothetical protein JMJ35_004276 [Cladonia borealis]|uniref:argininosuccinate lyase n=1 Tax=Cladonia borealis TaxID=184061 RepID=A0AA39R3T6_9LECA|nr:hypothetical protein JMJ35_004276 [Cladonia borealis]